MRNKLGPDQPPSDCLLRRNGWNDRVVVWLRDLPRRWLHGEEPYIWSFGDPGMNQARVLYAIALFLAMIWTFQARAQGEAPATFTYQGIDRHYYLHQAPN